MDNQAKEKVTHFAPTKKKLDQSDPMCGYVGTGHLVSMDPAKCNCVECLDWIRPNHDWSKTVPQP